MPPTQFLPAGVAYRNRQRKRTAFADSTARRTERSLQEVLTNAVWRPMFWPGGVKRRGCVRAHINFRPLQFAFPQKELIKEVSPAWSRVWLASLRVEPYSLCSLEFGGMKSSCSPGRLEFKARRYMRVM